MLGVYVRVHVFSASEEAAHPIHSETGRSSLSLKVPVDYPAHSVRVY